MAHSETAPGSQTPGRAQEALLVEQALYRRPHEQAPALVARSPGFADDWLAETVALLAGFGTRPAGVPCPSAVFARPFGKRRVAVVQVADLELDEPGRPAPLGFRVLVLRREVYDALFQGDPFAVADRFPPPWAEAASLPALPLPAEPLAPRTVEQVQRVLQRVKAHALAEDVEPPGEEEAWEREVALAESPALLGGVQILVDGGRVVFERPGPDTELMRGLWTLLPTRTRCELWPASFAFGNALGFDALIVRRATGETFAGYSNEDQAAEYPPGSYELRLQTAAEAGDQQELDALFARRSWNETWRLGLTILAFLLGVLLVLRLTEPGPRPPAPEKLRAEAPAAAVPERVAKLTVATNAIAAGDPFGAVTWLEVGNSKWGPTARRKR